MCAEQVEDDLMKDDGQVVGSPWAERSLAGSLVRARMIVMKIQPSMESLVNKLELQSFSLTDRKWEGIFESRQQHTTLQVDHP